MKKIDPAKLVPMDLYEKDFPIRVDVAYSRADNFLGEPIYHENARLWLHEDLAKVVLRAAQIAHEKHGVRFVLHDGLRTTDAQKHMEKIAIAQGNGAWLEEPRMLSPEGSGAHPRGMAIDIMLEDEDGHPLDKGTPFDLMSPDSSPAGNRAHRDHPHLTPAQQYIRAIEREAMEQAALELKIDLTCLPEEHWDYRIAADISNQHAPLADADLPPQMRCVNPDLAGGPPDFDGSHFEDQKKRLSAIVSACTPVDTAHPAP